MAERECCELLQLVQSVRSAFNGSYWTYPEECCRGGMDSISREEKQIQSGTQRKGIVWYNISPSKPKSIGFGFHALLNVVHNHTLE